MAFSWLLLAGWSPEISVRYKPRQDCEHGSAEEIRPPQTNQARTTIDVSDMAHTMYPSRQLAYAPTPYSYTPTSSLSATINLDEVGIALAMRSTIADSD